MELHWVSLLLSYLTLSDCMKNTLTCLSQEPRIIWRKAGNKVVLSCTVNPECHTQPWKYEWFLFKENSHILLKPGENSDKYKLDGASLQISALHTNDSGIYHCAAALRGKPRRGMQHVGPGTTLVVKEGNKTMATNNYLWVVFTLLTVYSLAMVTLIVKKYGCRKIHQIDKHNSIKKIQFRDVLQEMHRKKFREPHKQNSKSPQTEEDDDVYQNVETVETAN
ncbi:immunoglobulin superfamily member 6 isoform X1 [Takifugu flavidus]|uniref:immunoglobulin superfamily member 6 isoform X1 n=1 Tax=Takifugu flavidus TaxID=433684 RepID=UPI00254401B5|nr:immunoglobulin superfamily member 6 isoform X1 [Takifugu flavidus]XP_056870353.1 immunoglobulin superfamily member 6 isoform X1 [Takifugu flavidus]XP_056870354.1 immunoglobulin superfamily member 6 isoform X1 [Takifugu flavidus]